MAEATSQAPPVNNSGRLKYADPRSLPSFPSTGLRPDGAAAGAAATLGWNNQKPVELWKPDHLSSASAAAVLAKDYKMAPAWAPSSDSAGHKAALLAVGSAGAALKHQPSTSSKSQHEGWGNSAATQAFHSSRPASAQPNDLSHGSTAATQAFNTNRSHSARQQQTASPSLQGERSLRAAQGAMASRRPRATSTPASPDARESSQLGSKAASSALDGATKAHRASMLASPSVEDTGAVPVTTMTRNMFTSHPMVKPEVDQQQDSERLHQSAVEMAKKMYNQQQKMMDQARERGEDPEKAASSSPYLNLQDAAYKQAHDRLSKLHDEHQKNRDMQEYYGNASAAAPKKRFSVSNKLRRRHSDDDFDDHEESEKIRQQMSIFSNRLSEVNKTKQKEDRDALLAAAQRNVKARLHGMDEKVYNETGKVNPTLMSGWEVKAQAAAQLQSESRNENQGKRDIGGGMYMNQEQIDAIAAKRMQPMLDDINEKAENERERLAALKLEEESKKAEQERERERDREAKEITKQIREQEKQDEKAKKLQQKEDEKAKKEREKAEKAEQKRMAKEEKRKSKHDSGVAENDEREETEQGRVASVTHLSDEARGSGSHADEAEGVQREPPISSLPATEASPVAEPENSTTTTSAPVPVPATETIVTTNSWPTARQMEPEQQEEPTSPESPTSPGSKVKGWIKNRFSRRKSVVERGEEKESADNADKSGKPERRRSLFRGGAALRKKGHQNGSISSLNHRSSSMRDVAMAGKGDEEGQRDTEGAGPSADHDSRGVSPVSSNYDEEETRSRRGQGGGLAPPPPLQDSAPRSSISPNRDSRFREEMEH